MEKIIIGEKIGEKNAFTVNVNNKIYETYEDKSLLRFLRDDLKIKSVKDGCSQGACGTCTVIIDGVNERSCVKRISKLTNSKIITIEGLSNEQKDAFTYAFENVGAVQCGFCTPGMVMSGAALLMKNPNPSDDEIKEAIKHNICRCTGYVKIVEAIKLAAKILNKEQKIEKKDEDIEKVGSRMVRIDVHDKILGQGEYVDDMEVENLKYASAIRSKYPRARVVKIDFEDALKLEGVIGILTAKDVPNNKVGHIFQDWDVMIEEGDITRSQGDAICLVVAENEKILEEAKKLVKIEYEVLKPISSIKEAEDKNSPPIHPNGNLCQQRHVSRGDAIKAFEKCAYVVEESYTTPFTEHAFLEPECAIAIPYKDGVKIFTTDQSVYDLSLIHI